MKKIILRVIAGLAALILVGVVALVGLVEFKSRQTFPDWPKPEVAASTDPTVIERGQYLFHAVAHCSACHQGHTEQPEPFAAGEWPVPKGGYTWTLPFGVFRSANITPHPATGIGSWTDAELGRVIRTGVRRDGQFSPFMGLSLGALAQEDLIAIISYMRSIPPVENLVAPSEPNLMGKSFMLFIVPKEKDPVSYVAAAEEPSAARGQYLAQGPALCAGCHTHADPMNGFAPTGDAFGGGDAEPSEKAPGQEIAAPNITTHEKFGKLAKWDEEFFVNRLRSGRAIPDSKMPWENFQHMTDSDLRSLYRYLISVPPSSHDNGPNIRAAGWKPDVAPAAPTS